MNSVCGLVKNGWTCWNHQINLGTERVVHGVRKFLPRSIRPLTKGEYINQAQLVVHSIALIAFWGTTMCNPYLSTPLALLSAGVGIAVSAKPLYDHLKHHIAKMVELTPATQVDAAITTGMHAVIVGSIGLLGRCTIIPGGLRGNLSVLFTCSLVALCVSIVVHTAALHKYSKTSREDKEMEKVLCAQLKTEVAELERKLLLLESFIESRPEVKATWDYYVAEAPKLIDPLPTRPEKENSCELECYKIRLEGVLERREIFILSSIDLRIAFEKAVYRLGERKIEYLP